jgi:hypothetical protein
MRGFRGARTNLLLDLPWPCWQARRREHTMSLNIAMVVAFDGKKVVVESGDKPTKKAASALRKVGTAIRKVTKKDVVDDMHQAHEV